MTNSCLFTYLMGTKSFRAVTVVWSLELWKQFKQNESFWLKVRSSSRKKAQNVHHFVITCKPQLSFCINLQFVLCIEGTLGSIDRICGPVLKLPVRTKKKDIDINNGAVFAFHCFTKQTFLFSTCAILFPLNNVHDSTP